MDFITWFLKSNSLSINPSPPAPLTDSGCVVDLVLICCLCKVIKVTRLNPLKTNRRPLYLKTQSIPRC